MTLSPHTVFDPHGPQQPTPYPWLEHTLLQDIIVGAAVVTATGAALWGSLSKQQVGCTGPARAHD